MPIMVESGKEARAVNKQSYTARAKRDRQRTLPKTYRPDAAPAPARKPLPRTFRTERAAHPRDTPRERRASDAAIAFAKRQHVARQAAARKQFFPKNLVKATRESQRNVIKSFSELSASDPNKYERKLQEASDTKIAGVNVEKAGRNTNRALLKAAHATNKFIIDANARAHPLPADNPALQGMASGTAATEIIDLAANAPSSAYMTAASARAAAQGNPEPMKKLWSDYKKTSAIPAAISGNWKEAAKRAQERPITTALEISGGKAALGRIAGAVARHGPVPGKKARAKVREAGSLKRENLRLYPDAKPGEGPEIQRRYSKDIINKAGQKVAERHARRHGRDPNVDTGSRVAPALPRRMGGSEVPGERIHSRLIRRIDTRVFSQDRASQGRKAQAEREVRKLLKGHRKTAAGVQLVAEGTVRIGKVRADLKLRLGHLAKARPTLIDAERLRLNRAEAKHIRELLALPDEKLNRVAEASQNLAKQQAPVQARGHRAGAWTEVGQAKRFYPALQTRARRPAGEERRGLTPEEVRIAAKSLQQRYQKGKTLPPKAAAIVAEAERAFIPRPLPAKVRIGTPKPVKRSHFTDYLGTVRRRQHVPARKFNQEELANAARVLQRRERRGKDTLKGLTKGGPVLISQRPGRVRTGARLQPGAPFEPLKSRAGTAFEQGARPVGREAIERQAVGAESQVTAAEGFQLLDREFGISAGDKGRRYAQTRDKALEEGRRRTLDPATGRLKPNSIPLIPVNIAQFQTFGSRLRAKQGQGMPRGRASANDLERQAVSEMWDAAMAESGRGKWVLMPEPVVQRLREHASVGNFGPLHSLTNQFKDVVLTSSSPSRWIGGNIGDLGMRTVFAGITPMDIARGRMIVRNAASRGLQGEHAAAAVSGGGLYHASEALNRGGRPFGTQEHVARTVAAAPWRLWKGAIYGIEHAIEELPQFGTVGKAMRQETGRSVPVQRKNWHENWASEDVKLKKDFRSLLKLHDAQIDNFAAKLATDRAHEARIQKLTEDVIGRWGKVSPNMRRALLVAPFAQWLGAAMRYTFVTLPGKHPIKTSIIAGIHEMTEEERKALGLSYFLPRDKQVQDYQMGSLPLKVGKNKYGPVVEGVRTSRMTSLGTAAGFPGNVADFLLPQFSGPLDAVAGQSYTGEQLVYPDWWPEANKRRLPIPPDERIKIGLGALLEASIPFASAFRRSVLEGGAPAESWSTLLTPATRKKWDKENKKFVENKGTRTGGIIEWLMPFAPQQRLYTYGAGKAIQEQGITGETLQKWNAARKKKSGAIDLRAPEAAATPDPNATIPLRADPKPKVKVKPKADKLIPLR